MSWIHRRGACRLGGLLRAFPAVLVSGEIKLDAATDRHGVAGLRQCMNDLGLREGFVLSNTREPHSIGERIHVVPLTGKNVIVTGGSKGIGASRPTAS